MACRAASAATEEDKEPYPNRHYQPGERRADEATPAGSPSSLSYQGIELVHGLRRARQRLLPDRPLELV